jgi:hypothetical protein
VTTARIHYHVLEILPRDDWRPRASRPRDLLPWADPYIASLMCRLEDRYNVDEPAADDLCDPFAPEDESGLPPTGDEWEDAFVPRPAGAPRFHWHPPVYGGFPLLDDLPGAGGGGVIE